MNDKRALFFAILYTLALTIVFILIDKEESGLVIDVTRYERERDSLRDENRHLTEKINSLTRETDSVIHSFEEVINAQKKKYYEKVADLTRLSDDEHIRILSNELSRKDSLE